MSDDIASLSSYHIGFVIGPCLNAGGRLETARHAVSLLLEENPGEPEPRQKSYVHLMKNVRI